MGAGDERLKIHIVDDDEQNRKALAFLLTASGLSVTTHASGADFLSQADGDGRICLITDLKMPHMNGVELLQHLSRRTPAITTIVLSGQADIPLAIAAMQAGAFDVIEKPFDGETLLRAIRDASDGGSRFPPSSEIDARARDLTSVERQVLKDIMSGYSNRAIGQDLDISPRMVELHRASIMAKMRAASMTDLVRLTLSARGIAL
ncbi:MAG: response regulator transcription factor [Asticcacaulis sp.]|uniref:response regulator transcription factor n=1 Tax=Asticcacaulis sp. TaxID=1872648 RepID=UPI003F7B7D7A